MSSEVDEKYQYLLEERREIKDEWGQDVFKSSHVLYRKMFLNTAGKEWYIHLLHMENMYQQYLAEKKEESTQHPEDHENSQNDQTEHHET